MIQISPSPWAIQEMFQADALKHDDTWMPVGTIGHARPLMFDTTHGSWVSILRAKGSGTIQRHRHAAPVTAWTLDGAWGYREHDWVARAGSFVYEPAGHIHTLYIHPEPGSMTAVFHVFGPLIYVDADGLADGYEDVFVRIENYEKHCRSVGLGEDWVRSLIR